MDGKTLRDARQPDATQTKLVCVYDHASPLVLTQAAVAGGDEIAAFITVLDILPDLDGTLLTADALHCQRDHVPFLADRGGHYLVTVEANEPLLRRELARLPWGSAPGQRRHARGHGRTEARSIKVIDLDGTGAQALFPRAVRAIEVVRRRRRMRNRASVEIVYAVTSLDLRAADPGLLAAWIQGHWAIENAVHHVRDVTQGEDGSRIRTGHGPQVMAALRNTANNTPGSADRPTWPTLSATQVGDPKRSPTPSTRPDHRRTARPGSPRRTAPQPCCPPCPTGTTS